MEADKLVIIKSGLVKLIVSMTRTGAGTSLSEGGEEVGDLEETRFPGSGWSIWGK